MFNSGVRYTTSLGPAPFSNTAIDTATLERVERRSARLLVAPTPPAFIMSAWSSSTGKAQLSYADRLRQASKSNATAKQDTPHPHITFANRAVAHEAAKIGPSSSSLSAAAPSARSLSAATSSAGGASSPSAGASRVSATSSENPKSPATCESSMTSTATSGPPANVWEARRKQLADRQAEKERERQALLAQQKKAAPPASPTSGAAASPSKAKQSVSGPRKANERPSKPSSASGQSDRKSNKQTNQSSTPSFQLGLNIVINRYSNSIDDSTDIGQG